MLGLSGYCSCLLLPPGSFVLVARVAGEYYDDEPGLPNPGVLVRSSSALAEADRAIFFPLSFYSYPQAARLQSGRARNLQVLAPSCGIEVARGPRKPGTVMPRLTSSSAWIVDPSPEKAAVVSQGRKFPLHASGYIWLNPTSMRAICLVPSTQSAIRICSFGACARSPG